MLHWLQYVGLFVQAAAIWRMASLGLHRTYRWITISWTVLILRRLLLLPFKFTSMMYLDLWLWTQPVLWLAEICVVAEMYALVLKTHRGIYSVARYFLYGAVLLAAVAAILVTQPGPAGGGGILKLEIYDLFLRAQRGVSAGAALFLILLIVCLHWYPVRLSRNLVLCAVTYSSSYIANVILLFYLSYAGRLAAPLVSAALMSVSIMGYVAWLLLLSPQGESSPARELRNLPDELREQILRRLDTLNSNILGVGKHIN